MSDSLRTGGEGLKRKGRARQERAQREMEARLQKTPSYSSARMQKPCESMAEFVVNRMEHAD
jgi:hypothetical protein